MLTTFLTEVLGRKALADVEAEAANARTTKAFFMVDMLNKCVPTHQDVMFDFPPSWLQRATDLVADACDSALGRVCLWITLIVIHRSEL